MCLGVACVRLGWGWVGLMEEQRWGDGESVQRNVLRNFPTSPALLAVEWNFTNIPEEILQFGVS